MVLASSYDQSKYLRAEDVTQEKTLRIKNVTEELVGADQQKKLVVWFTNNPKGLPLNHTNNRTIRGAYGEVPALRVRIPPPKQSSGNGQTANPPPAPQTPFADAVATRPVPETELEGDDFDDEIPL